jgi:azurin
MIIRSFVCVCALAMVPVPSAAQATSTSTSTSTAKKTAAGTARTVEITGSETMKFDVTEITAKPGEKLRVVLKSIGSMPKIAMAHNFVLLKAGASAMEVSNAAFNARDTDFIPAAMKDKILAFTKLAGGGETVEVTFTAPSKAGKYDYLCTFPGHFAAGMKGVLTVK